VDAFAVTTIETLFGDDADVLRRSQYQLLLLANINAALGTVLISPLLESLTGPFVVTEAEAGLMITMFTAPSVVGISVVSAIAEHLGRLPRRRRDGRRHRDGVLSLLRGVMTGLASPSLRGGGAGWDRRVHDPAREQHRPGSHRGSHRVRPN
jgi:MFS family permease